MKLHLMASFRTNFSLKDEEVLASSEAYQLFWNDLADRAEDIKQNFGKVLFLHKAKERDGRLSRFRSVSTDSLLRSLHVVEIHIRSDCEILETAWAQAKDRLPGHFAVPEYLTVLDKLKLIRESVSVRIYNNFVALLQVDIDISDFVNELPKADVADHLEFLQEFGVTFGECISQLIYRRHIYDFMDAAIKKCSVADRFVFIDRFDFDSAVSNALLAEGSRKDEQMVRVNWVTRTLLVESQDDNNLETIIDHWLKDSGDQKLIDEARNDPGACAIRWLNYLFREQSYTWKRKDDGAIDYARPFADEWQAMLNAQYYYAAFEALNDSLTSTLSHSYRKPGGTVTRSTADLRELGRQLEQDIITANLATLEYHNNYAYYKREVGNTMKEIMKGWDFDEAILKEVTRKTTLCEQRIDELHKKAESRSGFYSDLLLLAIALISVSAFLFQINEYGRTMSHNAELAVYESNTWNLIQFISERPTDFVIWLSLALIVIFGALYAWFRRLKVMD
ncbi:MAG: hypothetical protein AB2551_03155 [Candidatus Thiodiazotropha sp.]